jgi:O-antigen ligase
MTSTVVLVLLAIVVLAVLLWRFRTSPRITRLRIWRLVVLWTAALTLVITIFIHGGVEYYCYANDQGQEYELKTYQGTSLDDKPYYQGV